MTALPSQIPPGIDPTAYLNWVAQMQSYLAREQNRGNEGESDLIIRLLEDAQRKQDQARQDNENRRLEILKGRVDTRNRVLGDVNQYGDSLLADTNRDSKTSLNNSLSALAGSGLLHSTENASIRAVNERERQDAQRRNKDSLLSHRIGADERLSNSIDDFQERVTDSYPNLDANNDLLQRLGQSGYGGALTGSVGDMVRNPATPTIGYASARGTAPTSLRTSSIGSGIGPRPTAPAAGSSAPITNAIGPRPAPINPTPIGSMVTGDAAASMRKPSFRAAPAPPVLRAPVPTAAQLQAQRTEQMRQANIQSQMAQQKHVNSLGSNFTVYNPRQPGDAPSMVPQQIVQDLPPGVSRIQQGQPQFGNTGGYGDSSMMDLLGSLYSPQLGGYGNTGPQPMLPNNRFEYLQRLRNSGRNRRNQGRMGRQILGAPAYPSPPLGYA